MAMNKKERAAFDAALNEARVLGALRWTFPVEKDVMRPDGSIGAHTEGWDINSTSTYSAVAFKAWSESCSHGTGDFPIGNKYRSASQGGVSLYSTKLLALRAVRHEVEKIAAKRLAEIDAMIAEESASLKC